MFIKFYDKKRFDSIGKSSATKSKIAFIEQLKTKSKVKKIIYNIIAIHTIFNMNIHFRFCD